MEYEITMEKKKVIFFMFCLINYNKRSCIKVQTNTLISGQHHCLFMSCRYDLFFFTSLTFLSLFVALTLVSLLSLKDSRARVFLHGYLWKFSFTIYIYIMGLLWVFLFFFKKKNQSCLFEDVQSWGLFLFNSKSMHY